MTKVAIIPEKNVSGAIAFRAMAGKQQTVGKTAGEALDALTALLPQEESATLIIVQNHQPDRFFNEEQQKRLQELMARWRETRTAGKNLAPEEQAELDDLVAKELQAASNRAAALLQELQP